MSKERIRRQLGEIVKKYDPEVVKQVSGVLLKDRDRRIKGFRLERSNEVNLGLADGGEKAEIVEQVRSEICIWANGLFGIRTQSKIGVLEEMVQARQETV